jgi:hypothetical protein
MRRGLLILKFGHRRPPKYEMPPLKESDEEDSNLLRKCRSDMVPKGRLQFGRALFFVQSKRVEGLCAIEYRGYSFRKAGGG